MRPVAHTRSICRAPKREQAPAWAIELAQSASQGVADTDRIRGHLTLFDQKTCWWPFY